MLFQIRETLKQEKRSERGAKVVVLLDYVNELSDANTYDCT
jgi:hypothetical protein